MRGNDAMDEVSLTIAHLPRDADKPDVRKPDLNALSDALRSASPVAVSALIEQKAPAGDAKEKIDLALHYICAMAHVATTKASGDGLPLDSSIMAPQCEAWAPVIDAIMQRVRPEEPQEYQSANEFFEGIIRGFRYFSAPHSKPGWEIRNTSRKLRAMAGAVDTLMTAMALRAEAKHFAEEIADSLLGSCDSVNAVLEDLDLEHIPQDVVEDAIADMAEVCQGCGWWFEPGELNHGEDLDPDERWTGYCPECAHEEGMHYDE